MGRWKENKNCIMKMRMNLFPLICILILISFWMKNETTIFLNSHCPLFLSHYHSRSWFIIFMKRISSAGEEAFCVVCYILNFSFTFCCTFSLFHFIFHHLLPSPLMLIGNESTFKIIWFQKKEEEKIIKINV